MCPFNVRINNKDQVKVSCFGATPFDDHGKALDLSRWRAPEVQRFQHHSDRCDVWAFGCLMWETCTLGATPYAAVITGDLATYIPAGGQPVHVPFIFDERYQLFANFWELNPSERTSFLDISNLLRQFCSVRKETMILKYITQTKNVK